MTTAVHKVTLLIIDHDRIGPDSVAFELENTDYANDCMSPRVMDLETVEIQWDDDHPINKREPATRQAAFRELFPLPRVTVGYELGDDATEPTVVVEPEGSVEVVLNDDGAEARLVMTRNGVSIYKCDNDCTLSDYWVSTIPYTSSEADDAFDIRDLSIDDLTEEQIGRYQAELGPLGDDDHMIALAYYIDQGYITEDGLELPEGN